MSKNNVIIALAILCLLGAIWGSVGNKKNMNLQRQLDAITQGSGGTEAVAEGDGAQIAGDSKELDTLKQAKKELLQAKKDLLAEARSQKQQVAVKQTEIDELQAKLAEIEQAAAASAAVQENLSACTGELVNVKETNAILETGIKEAALKLEQADQQFAVLGETQNALISNIDMYSAQVVELGRELDASGARIQALERALEERTKVLIAGREEFDRTKLNMEILLAKISAQANDIKILGKMKVALEEELELKFIIIREMEQQLGSATEAPVEQ